MCQPNGAILLARSAMSLSAIGMPPLLSVLSLTPRAPVASRRASSASLMLMSIAMTQRARLGVSALSAAMPSRMAELSVP